MSARLFIRNDDVCRLDKEFRFFFDAAFERDIPVVHAVIPGRLDQACTRFLCRAKQKKPHLLDIVQHGWVHANHARESSSKYEFGALRSLQAQRQDIEQGLEKMHAAFGKHLTNAFVPPYHGYDSRTLKVIEEKGFRLFSAGGRAAAKKCFKDIPAEVSFNWYEKDSRGIYSAAAVLAALMRSVPCRPLSGVLTHHAEFKDAASRRELIKFFDCVSALKAKRQWQILLFSDILNGAAA